ncbi:MAG: hypothetical protein LBO20_10000, partial [Bifidobacteriaceae bacterium]|nr:hypothetical protein [Bifidobacteriaceae bacterium]
EVSEKSAQGLASAAEVRLFGSAGSPAVGFAPIVRGQDDQSGCQEAPPIPAPTLVHPVRVVQGDAMAVALAHFAPGASVDLVIPSKTLVIGKAQVGPDGGALTTAVRPGSLPPVVHRLEAEIVGQAVAASLIQVVPRGGASASDPPPGPPDDTPGAGPIPPSTGGADDRSGGGPSGSLGQAAGPGGRLPMTGPAAAGSGLVLAAAMLAVGAGLRRRAARHGAGH